MAVPSVAAMNSRPGILVAAVVIVFVQSFLNLAAGVLGLVEISDRVDHNQEVTGAMYVLGWGSVVAAGLLVLGGVLLLRGIGAARALVAVLEGFSVIGGLVTILSGAPQAVIGIGMAVLVLVLMSNSQTTVWFIQKRTARSVY